MKIIDYQQSKGYEDGHWKGAGDHICWCSLIYLNSSATGIDQDCTYRACPRGNGRTF